MHSVHRDLETKHKRALNELASLQNTNEQLATKVSNNVDEITELKTIRAENESKINYNEEKLNALQREINIKIRQVEDYEQRYSRTQDELDLTKYKLQESMKDVTELRLKIDVNESSIEGFRNEKTHLELELKETKELQKIYEVKCGKLMLEVNKVNLEFQESKREIIGFGEIQKEREERIDKLKKDHREIKMLFDDIDLKHGTLTIQHEKVREQYDNSKKDLDDAIDKLHITNKVRHETEVKLHEEVEKNRNLMDIIKDKEETLAKRATELDELDRKVIELERSNEALEIKKAGIERSYELTKK
jgi:chromosome segregation ATPase